MSIAGLSAARTVQAAGITDFAVLELEDAAGGNSRGHSMWCSAATGPKLLDTSSTCSRAWR